MAEERPDDPWEPDVEGADEQETARREQQPGEVPSGDEPQRLPSAPNESAEPEEEPTGDGGEHDLTRDEGFGSNYDPPGPAGERFSSAADFDSSRWVSGFVNPLNRQMEDLRRAVLGAALEPLFQAEAMQRSIVGDLLNPWTQQVDEMRKAALAGVLSPIFDVRGIADAVLGQTNIAERFILGLPKIDFTGLLESVKRWIPSNWPDDADYDRLEGLLNDDGLPAVWVPPASILAAMLAADDRDARVEVLLANADAVAADARAVLEDVTHGAFEGQVPLAQAAVDAWLAGHHAPAQALAVAVTENAVTRLVAEGRSYREVAEDVRLDIDDVPITELRLRAALAPLSVFYTPHWLADGEVGDRPLSRHLTVHQPHAAHHTSGNAIVAVLLMASVLRSLQDYQVDLDDLAEQRAVEPVTTQALADLADWSAWTPLADAIRDAPSEVGVYLVRDDDAVVYVGVASRDDRAGSAGDRGLKARFAMYLAGRLPTSRVGDVLLTRALSDRQWLSARLEAVEAGFPQSARQWAQDAVVTAEVQVAWAVTADKQSAKNLRDAVVVAEPDGLAWQR